MSLDLAIEKAVECAFLKHIEPLLSRFNIPQPPQPAELRMTSEEAGRYLGGTGKPIAASTLRFWRCMGHGPVYHRYGNAVRYHKSDLDRFMAENVALKPGGRESHQPPVAVDPSKKRRGRPPKWVRVPVTEQQEGK
jgi:hypothetical protein